LIEVAQNPKQNYLVQNKITDCNNNKKIYLFNP
jgi:hypothetical protein